MTQRAKGTQFFWTFMTELNIWEARKMTESKFHAAYLQILGATVRKLFAMANCAQYLYTPAICTLYKQKY